jgi:phenylalanyl-tRNA synthetase alpha chain
VLSDARDKTGQDAVREARDAALETLREISSRDALEEWRTAVLGRKGRFSELLRQIPQLEQALRPAFGAAVNAAKQELEAAYEEAVSAIRASDLADELAVRPIDVTLPGSRPPRGGLHPSTRILRRIYSIFSDMGFQVYLSREVETDERNFTLLNMPPHHPARDMQDTFYVDDATLLRTHTSPGQIHAMRAYAPDPIRIILPGMCYRHEQLTPRSESQFHQVEGLAVGYSITFMDLKGTLESFAHRLFGQDRAVRFRPSYFPFTEPSAEMDVRCILCQGDGCRVCKHTGWLEILGCGMVHPQVLANGGYDPERFTGFAFGMGIERSAMNIYEIDDIRRFWANDLRFLRQLR